MYKKRSYACVLSIQFLLSLLVITSATWSVSAQDSVPQVGFVHWHYVFETEDQQNEVMQLLKNNDVKYIHGQIDWADIEIAPGTYVLDGSKYDRAFQLLRDNNIKIYLSFGGGVDGQIETMPSFYFPQAWHANPTEGNSLTWDYEHNVATLVYTKPQVQVFQRRVTAEYIDLQHGDTFDLTVPIKCSWGSSGVPKPVNVLVDYFVASLGFEWLGATTGTMASVDCDDNWHLIMFPQFTINTDVFTVPPSSPPILRDGSRAFDPDKHLLVLTIGTGDQNLPAGEGFELGLDLKSVEVVKNKNRPPEKRFDPALFMWANPDQIRWSYNQASQNSPDIPAIEPHDLSHDLTYRIVNSDTSFQAMEEQWIRKTVQWIEQNYSDVVVAYGPTNEPWGYEGERRLLDYSESNRQAFIASLRAKYENNIEKLNEAWNASGIGRTYAYINFQDVEIPKLPLESGTFSAGDFWNTVDSTPDAWLDFHNYMREEYIFGYLNSRLQIFKQEAPNKPTFVKFLATVPFSDHIIHDAMPRFAASPYLDIVGVDLYSFQMGSLDPMDIASVRTTFVSAATIAQRYGKQWGIFELGVSIPDHTDAVVADLMRYAAAYGPAAIFAYKLVDLPVYSAPTCPDPPCHEGYYRLSDGVDPGPKAEFAPVTAAIRQLAGQEVISPPADVAILFSTYTTAYRGNITAIKDIQRALSDMGVRTTVLYDYEVREHSDPAALLSQFKAVVVPYLRVARPTEDETLLLDTLNNYIAAGGKVIIETLYDRVSSNLGSIPFEKTNETLDALPVQAESVDWAGQQIEFVDPTYPWGQPIDTVSWEGQVHFMTDSNDNIPGAEILARYNGTHDPAIVRSADANVLVIGPQLLWETSQGFNLTQFLQTFFDTWGLLPLHIEQGQGIIAHSGLDGLSIGNNTDQDNKPFRIKLPFVTKPIDPVTGVTFTVSGDETTIEGTLNSRQVVFTRLDVARDKEFVEANYRHYLNRASDSLGFAAHLRTLQGLAPRSALIGSFTNSTEYQTLVSDESFVEELYQGILGRASETDPLGRRHWLDELAAGRLRSEVIDAFFDSAGYAASVYDKPYLIRLYWNILGRVPDSAGFLAHLQALQAGTPRSQVRTTFFDSAEFRSRQIYPADAELVSAILGWGYYAILGDLNGDRSINYQDFGVFVAGFGRCDGQPGFNADADFDGDGCITLVDYQTWYAWYVLIQ